MIFDLRFLNGTVWDLMQTKCGCVGGSTGESGGSNLKLKSPKP